MKAPISDLADFAALDPFFRIVEQGLDGLAGPGHWRSSTRSAGRLTEWFPEPVRA